MMKEPACASGFVTIVRGSPQNENVRLISTILCSSPAVHGACCPPRPAPPPRSLILILVRWGKYWLCLTRPGVSSQMSHYVSLNHNSSVKPELFFIALLVTQQLWERTKKIHSNSTDFILLNQLNLSSNELVAQSVIFISFPCARNLWAAPGRTECTSWLGRVWGVLARAQSRPGS